MFRLPTTLAFLLSSCLAAQEWEDTPTTTQIWQLISMGEGGSDSFREFAVMRPNLMEERSSDGRGALFWAWEFGNTRALLTLAALDNDVFDEKERDARGRSPTSLCKDDADCDYDAVADVVNDPVRVEEEKDLIAEVRSKLEEAADKDLDEMDEEEEDDGGGGR
ncbi:hypothetical protein FOZ62_028341 [Perkinsus olseni]|uniref:Uncharacterized protein n=1 Tax=Perkinsus olseni TaxID=32597 RepID=A0A7J6RB82_PEROL|nr:hypothetical protein FOZ62_028341 [Perkinsus olseni]